MKRTHAGLDVVRWRLDIGVRLALMVPMDNVRRSVQPGLRSVYYCPPPPDMSSGTGIVIDGLAFELYALVGETLTDDELHGSFLYSYLYSEMLDKATKTFADTPYGTALGMLWRREDTGLLTIVTVPPGTMDPVRYDPFEQAKTATRLVRITVRSHAMFVFLVNRYGRDDHLTRNRDDPSRAQTHALLLLCMQRGPARKPRKGGATVRAPHRIQSVPSLRLVREYQALELLLNQLRLAIDDLVRLNEYERKRILVHSRQQAERLANGDYGASGTTGTSDTDGVEVIVDPYDLSGFVLGSNQLYASAPRDFISDCSGMLVPGLFRLPRELEGPINLPHLHKAWGAKPWLLEAPVEFGHIHRIVMYESITFNRTIGGQNGTLDGANGSATIRFKTHEEIMSEYVPPPPSLIAASKKKKKSNTKSSKSTKSKAATVSRPTITDFMSPGPRVSSTPIDMAQIDSMVSVSLKQIKTEK